MRKEKFQYPHFEEPDFSSGGIKGDVIEKIFFLSGIKDRL